MEKQIKDNTQLDLHIERIIKYQDLFLDISKIILLLLKNEKQKDLKLCVMSILKRVVSTIEGIKILIENKNFTSVAPLSRIYLDNLIRLYAFSLCNKPNEMAIKVLSGEKIRNLKDKYGNRMFDKYLVDSLSEHYFWIKNVYNRTSGYVHFSFQHHLDMIVEKEETEEYIRTIYFMSKDDPYVKIESWLEITTLILEVSKAISKLINDLLSDELSTLKENKNENKNTKQTL